MTAPADALRELAERLRAEQSVISALVVDPRAEPVWGELVAAGPAAARDPAGYAVVIEAIREGYLLHYREPRLIAAADRDLTLLAGDYLYALGLDQLAEIGDLAAVRQLADLIAALARIHAERRPDVIAEALWISTSVAIALGESEPAAAMGVALADAGPQAAATLIADARSRAAAGDPQGRLTSAIGRATDSIDLRDLSP